MNIYVSNLPYSLEEQELKKLFETYGRTESVIILKDKKKAGRSRGIGFVNMPDFTDAKKAIVALHESDLNGRTITVKEADNQR